MQNLLHDLPHLQADNFQTQVFSAKGLSLDFEQFQLAVANDQAQVMFQAVESKTFSQTRLVSIMKPFLGHNTKGKK